MGSTKVTEDEKSCPLLCNFVEWSVNTKSFAPSNNDDSLHLIWFWRCQRKTNKNHLCAESIWEEKGRPRYKPERCRLTISQQLLSVCWQARKKNTWWSKWNPNKVIITLYASVKQGVRGTGCSSFVEIVTFFFLLFCLVYCINQLPTIQRMMTIAPQTHCFCEMHTFYLVLSSAQHRTKHSEAVTMDGHHPPLLGRLMSQWHGTVVLDSLQEPGLGRSENKRNREGREGT